MLNENICKLVRASKGNKNRKLNEIGNGIKNFFPLILKKYQKIFKLYTKVYNKK